MKMYQSKPARWFAACALLSLPMTAFAWEPSEKDLDAALQAADFTGYYANMSAWLDQKSPSDAGKVTEEAMVPLLQDPVFRNTLDQRRLVETHGVDKLNSFAKNEAKRAFLAWVMKDTSRLDMYMEYAAPGIEALERWFKLYTEDPESQAGIYLKLAMSAAIWPPGGVGQYRGDEPIEWQKRYNNFKTAHKNKDLVPSFDHLMVCDYARCLNCIGADTDMNWARQMIHDWRPDLMEKEQIHKIVSEVWRRFSPFGFSNGYITVLEGGGKCGPRGMFGQFVCNALGVPAIGVGQPQHCTFAARCDFPETEPQAGSLWKVYQGRGWEFSDCGGCNGAQFTAQEAKKYRTAEWSLVQHLNWLAPVLATKERTEAVKNLATKVVKPVNTTTPMGVPASECDVVFAGKATKTDPAKKDAAIDYNAEGPPAVTDASNTASTPPRVKEAPFQLAPGVIHVEAEAFTKNLAEAMYPTEQEGRVFVFDSWTGGKQLYFQRNMKTNWAEYLIDVPLAGTYSLEVMLAAANRDQVLEVSCGQEKLATVAIPGTTGLWKKMQAVDIKLNKGPQTLRLTSPALQRGISIRWFELTPKQG
ncbi:MAG: hypothetical protein WCO57_02895 [Verrucomicrobiota bacterium]